MDQAEHESAMQQLELDKDNEIQELEREHERALAEKDEKITELEERIADMGRTFAKIEELAGDY